jgi:hypothetical protein
MFYEHFVHLDGSWWRHQHGGHKFFPSELNTPLNFSLYKTAFAGAVGTDATEMAGLLLNGACCFLVETAGLLNSRYLILK